MICNVIDPTLSSIQFNAETDGYKTAQMINEMIENKETAGRQILVSPSHIVQRQSSDVLAKNDPEVLKAIFYIKKNCYF